MQVSDDRDAWSDECRRLVDRRQVVQVQRVGIGGADLGEHPRPCRDLTVMSLVVERREHPVHGRLRP